MVLKRTNWPMVSRPSMYVAAAEEDHRGDRDGGQEEQRRQVRGLDARLAHDGVAHDGRLAIRAAGAHAGPLRAAVHRLKYGAEPGLAQADAVR